MTILAGVLASKGSLSIWLVIPVAAGGVFAGDNMMFFLGRRLGEPLSERICRHARGRRWLDDGRRLIEGHGEVVILVGRFIPAGRTAATFSAGMLELSWRRFAAADVAAGILWAVYAAMLGYLGGSAFEHSFWKPFLVAIGIAFLVAGLGEGWRRLQERRGHDVLGGKR